MKKVIKNNSLKVLLAIFVILSLFFALESISYAGEASKWFWQGKPKGLEVVKVKYSADEDGDGEKDKLESICFYMPTNDGQVAFVDSNRGALIVNGTDIVKFNITFTYGDNFVLEITNPTLTTNSDGRGILYTSGLEVKDGDVYYNGKRIASWNDFRAGLKFQVDITAPAEEVDTIKLNIQGWEEKSEKGKFFLLAWLDWLKDKALSIVSNIFADLLINIAEAIRSLISSIFGEDVTLGMVIYNQVDKLNIDFWQAGDIDASNPGSASIGQILKPLVSFWYGKFQGIVFIVYICILLYAGVQILLSSTAGSLDKAKDLLSSWLLGLLLLVMFPTCMKYIVQLNNSMVELVQIKSNEITNNTDNVDAMDKISQMVREYKNIPLCIVYIIMLGELIVLLAVYYKRAFTLAYLIVIFPVVIGYNIFEKVKNTKKAMAFSNWMKEFCVTVFIQLVHAVVYSVLIEGVLSTFREENGVLKGNVILYVFCVTFLFKAEAITKSIFSVKSPGNAIGDAITSAATLGAVTKQATSLIGGNKGNSQSESEDKKDAGKHESNVKQMESNASQKNKEEANKQEEKKDDKKDGAGSGGGSSESGEGSRPKHSSGKETEGDPNYQGKHAKKESSGEPKIEATQKDNRSDALKEAEKAKEVLAHLASKKRTKGVPGRIAKGAISGAMRTTAITAGVLSGLAAGDVQKAISNAVIFDGTAKKAARGVNKITGAAANRLGGAIMRAKVQHGGYKKQLKKAGVDVDKIYGDKKDKAVQSALAQFASAQRRGGDPLGDMKWAKAVNTKLTERETREKSKK